MKKFTALLLLLAMALSLAACGPSGSGETNPPSTSSTPPSSSAQTEAPTESPIAPPATEPEVNNQVVEYYMSKANEVTVTDTQVLFTDDGSGQELAIDKEPKKVAVLYGSHREVLRHRLGRGGHSGGEAGPDRLLHGHEGL